MTTVEGGVAMAAWKLRVQPGFDGCWIVLHGVNGKAYIVNKRAIEGPACVTTAKELRDGLLREYEELGPDAWCAAHGIERDALPST
jgi:hypothetical protein